MLVLPLDRIFRTIRENAAQIIDALGDSDMEPGEGGAGGGAGAPRLDDDMSTIEAAVVKMSRIVTHFTSAGGVGLNVVKKFAEVGGCGVGRYAGCLLAGFGGRVETRDGGWVHGLVADCLLGPAIEACGGPTGSQLWMVGVG